MAIETARATLIHTNVEGVDPQEAAYHMNLMAGEGLIEARVIPKNDGSNEYAAAIAFGMTWRGHELLDSIRNEGVWSDVKKRFKEKGFDMTTDLVIDLAKKLMGSTLGLGA